MIGPRLGGGQMMRGLAAKYFDRAAQATVVFSREAKGRRFRCNIRFLVASDIDFAGQVSTEMTASADARLRAQRKAATPHKAREA
ncbi:hypothetical protein [Plastoroseomonas hellenica]|uniref:hypothetical protein n=1 Tax=Plastoroseomonas hellenica TaxID=2687306 RepID=UPI001BADCC28|nr:hypothetical protein [Plastoroseomonas hellenica]MBR0646885.1 HPF/RaiA family ribosome-associated protein [Plastoroseomonas hellenica]